MRLSHGRLSQLPHLLARPLAFRLPQSSSWGLRSPGASHFISSPPTCKAKASRDSTLGALTPNAPAKEGIRFQYEPAHTRLSFRTWHQRRQQRAPTSTKPEVDIMVEGQPLGGQLSSEQLETLCRQTKECTELVLPKALLAKVQARPDFKLPRVGAVSVVLCDDAHITTLNAAHRGKAAPTDVLSFELEDDLDYKMHLPIKLLGDLVVSLDTAQRQAEERGYGLLDELRVLLVHGMLHLCGLDHERSHQDLAAMAAAEQAIMAQLGWKGQGLIDAVGGLSTEPERAGSGSSSSSSSSSSSNGRVDEPLKERAASSKGASSSSSASLPTPTPGTSLAARRKRSGSGNLGVLGNIFGGAGDGPSTSDSEGGSGGANEGRSAPAAAAAAAAERGGGEKGKRGAQMVDSSGSGSKKRGGRGKEQGVSGPGGSSTRGISTSAAASPSTMGSSSSSKSQSNRIQGSGGRSSSSNSSSSSSSSSSRPLSTSIPSSSRSNSTSSSSGAGCSSSTSPLLRSGIGGISHRPLASGRVCTPLLCSAAKDGASTSTTGPISLQQQQQQLQQLTREQLQEPIRLVALDMDGTLLDNSSRIHPDSAEAIKAACAAGVRVLLATGKARPAAIRAADMAGLAGDNLLVSARTPGIFLQGLAVHDSQGQQLSNASLPSAVVADAFRYVSSLEGSAGGSLVAFLGDECVTLRMTDDLQALHHIYHEPLATVLPSLEALLEGPPVRKLLFMSTPQNVTHTLTPYWSRALQGMQAVPLQAVPSMLEIVPAGVDKWVGMRTLLEHLDLPHRSLMAVGDGMNDLQLVANAGVGVAVGNAVPDVKAAAAYTASRTNHEGGVAEAFERFVL